MLITILFLFKRKIT